MMVRTTSAEEFFSVFPTPSNAYGSRGFYEATPAGDTLVRCFIGYDKMRPRYGLIAGLRDGVWRAPYSAPFTDIISNGEPEIESFYDFITEITTILDAPLHITTPPDFYGHSTGGVINGVLGNLARKCVFDYDFYYGCGLFPQYREMLNHAARKNLARAEKSGFEFMRTTDIDRAYAVIRANRESHGYPLAMSLEQVKATVEHIPADFFVLTLSDTDVAAAMVYHAADSIAQVIYWGDAPGHSDKRPMNLLACKVFEYYADRDFLIVDVGPSSTDGIPNAGLCRFKQSVGCSVALKPTYIL